MEIPLDRPFSCPACGGTHTIPTRHLEYGDGAVERLLDCIAREMAGGPVLVVGDERTMAVAGGDILAAGRDRGLEPVGCTLPDRQGLTPGCEPDNRQVILEARPPGCTGLVAVGSGVVSDLTKWAAFAAELPYFVFATAPSMNGYGSANVAATVDGVKVLVRAQGPRGIFATPAVMEGAPAEMLAAGLGDTLAKFVSGADWLLNHILFDEYYCRYALDMVGDLERLFLDSGERLAAREPAAVADLFLALVRAGFGMTIVGTSAPASGGEHLFSHAFDMLAHRDGGEHDLHGRQVGVGTILSAALYHAWFAAVEDRESPAAQGLPPAVDTSFWGDLTPHIHDLYGEKVDRAAGALERLAAPGFPRELAGRLRDLVPQPARIRRCLAAAGAAWQPAHIGVDRHRAEQVWTRCHQMRARFTILDLARMFGLMPGCAGPIVAD